MWILSSTSILTGGVVVIPSLLLIIFGESLKRRWLWHGDTWRTCIHQRNWWKYLWQVFNSPADAPRFHYLKGSFEEYEARRRLPVLLRLGYKPDEVLKQYKARELRMNIRLHLERTLCLKDSPISVQDRNRVVAGFYNLTHQGDWLELAKAYRTTPTIEQFLTFAGRPTTWRLGVVPKQLDNRNGWLKPRQEG